MSNWRGFRMFYSRVKKIEIQRREKPLEQDEEFQKELKGLKPGQKQSKNKTALFHKYRNNR